MEAFGGGGLSATCKHVHVSGCVYDKRGLEGKVAGSIHLFSVAAGQVGSPDWQLGAIEGVGVEQVNGALLSNHHHAPSARQDVDCRHRHLHARGHIHQVQDVKEGSELTSVAAKMI
jgi:hypothetical protein